MGEPTAMQQLEQEAQPGSTTTSASLQSRIGLNGANFFLAEVTGVVLPFLAKFLGGAWLPGDDAVVEVAVALAGLGVFPNADPRGFPRGPRPPASHSPGRLVRSAGTMLRANTHRPGLLVAGRSAAVHLRDGSGILPAAVGGAGPGFGRPCGAEQDDRFQSGLEPRRQPGGRAYRHAHRRPVGDGLRFLRRDSRLRPRSRCRVPDAGGRDRRARASGKNRDANGTGSAGCRALLRDRPILILFAATALFHLANAPVMPLVGRYIDHLGGSDRQVAAVVLVAQGVMIPVALLTGWLADRWGRKPVFAIGFVVLPAYLPVLADKRPPDAGRFLRCCWMGSACGHLWRGVIVLCADLTRGKGGFNALQGLIATALSVGGVLPRKCRLHRAAPRLPYRLLDFSLASPLAAYFSSDSCPRHHPLAFGPSRRRLVRNANRGRSG